MSNESEIPCRFCKWLKKWDDFVKEEGYRLIYPLNLPEKPNKKIECFAILAPEQKTIGHTLVISGKKDDNKEIKDIADDKLGKEHLNSIMDVVRKISRAIKSGLGADKVYVYTMCDHFEPEEIKFIPKMRTEHLHFHLLPRYKNCRKGEDLFAYPDKVAGVDWQASRIGMEQTKDAIVKAFEKIRSN